MVSVMVFHSCAVALPHGLVPSGWLAAWTVVGLDAPEESSVGGKKEVELVLPKELGWVYHKAGPAQHLVVGYTFCEARPVGDDWPHCIGNSANFEKIDLGVGMTGADILHS